MRGKINHFALAAALCFAACQQQVPNAKPVSPASIDADKVADALAAWPKVASGGTPVKRTFFATIHVVGQRTTASGMLEYYGPRDFRLTAVTELGVILFDGRMNWAGVTILRQMPGIPSEVIDAMFNDLCRAFDLPQKLDGLRAGDNRMILEKKRSDERRYTWIFDRSTGHLLTTEVNLGLLDTLRVDYKSYTPQGWPKELQVNRNARGYDLSFTFTDQAVTTK